MKRNEVDISDLLFCQEFQPSPTEQRITALRAKFGYEGVWKYKEAVLAYKEKHAAAYENSRVSPMQSLRYHERQEMVLHKWFKMYMHREK